MDETFTFQPPVGAGIIFHLAGILVLLVSGGIGLYRMAYVAVGPAFTLYLILIILAILLVPFLIYRLIILLNAVYQLGRDSIRLQWGLRVEVIPTNTILWIQPAVDLTEKVRYPWFRWPGSVFGKRRLGGGTMVEYMASRTRDLILVATYERVFGISPADPGEFLRVYQRLTEMGSLVSPLAQSVRPTFLLARIWGTPKARYLILTSFLLSLALVAWVSLVAPTRGEVSLGFQPSGVPRERIPGIRLMLLPVLNTMIWVFNFIFGVFLFRRDDLRLLGYLLWGNSVFVTGLFLIAVYFILHIG